MTFFALFASIALAQTSDVGGAASTTPYATLYAVVAPVSKINAYDHLIAMERIESKLPDVRPEDIRVVIHAKQGAIAVPVAAGGEVKFPVSDALREENPPVETNQPKGSLALIVNVALRTGDGLRVPWSDIEAGLTQVKAFYADSRGASAPAISGVEVHFSTGSAAMLTIEGNNERLLMADPAGRIIVTRDVVLQNKEPVLVFSRAPEFVLPYTDEKK